MLSFFAFIPAVPLSRTCLLYLNVEQLERVKHQLLLDPVVHSSFGPGLHPFLTPAPPPTYFSLFQAHILRSQPHKCFVRFDTLRGWRKIYARYNKVLGIFQCVVQNAFSRTFSPARCLSYRIVYHARHHTPWTDFQSSITPQQDDCQS